MLSFLEVRDLLCWERCLFEWLKEEKKYEGGLGGWMDGYTYCVGRMVNTE